MVKLADAASGAHVSQVVAGQSKPVPAGDYIARAKLDGIEVTLPLSVAVDGAVALVIVLDAAPVAFDMDHEALKRWHVYNEAGNELVSRRPGKVELAIPAGAYVLELRMEDGAVEQRPFIVTAGDPLTVSF